MDYRLNTICVILAAFGLAGCEGAFGNGAGPRVAPPEVEAQTAHRPPARPAPLQTVAAKPARSAHTAEQFDTTTSEQRAEAVAVVPAGGERKLGVTVGSLGNPAEPGFWLKTPLVSVAGKGRIEYPVTGKTVAVDLIPIDGPKTAGSRVSLAALRLLGAPLTGLPDLIVYAE